MKKNIKFLIFALLLSGGFFSLGLFNSAQAACSYKINFYERDGKTSVTPADYLSFVTTVVRSGSDTDCAKGASISLLLKTKSGTQTISQSGKDFVTVSGMGSTAVATQGLEISSVQRGDLPEVNVMEFYPVVLVSDSSNGTLHNIATSVAHIKINVTGSVGSTGSVSANVYFKDGNTGTTKASFKANDQLQILVQTSASSINSLDSSVGNIYAAVYVNNFNKEVISMSAARTIWASQTQYKSLAVSTANGFVDGTNTIRVKFFKANEDISLGYSDATLQAQGLGASGGVKCGSTTCATGQTCVNNVCQAATGDGNGDGTGDGTGGGGGMQSQSAQTLYNPIKSASNLTELLLKIMRGFLYIIGIWAVAFIVIGGFKLVISQGNEEAVAAAKKGITWAIIGLVVALLAFSIIAIIQNLIGIDVKDVKTSQAPISTNYKQI